MSLPETNKNKIEELETRVKSLEDELDLEYGSSSGDEKSDDEKSDDESKSGVNNNEYKQQLDENSEKRRKKYTEEDVATEESRKDKLFELDDRLTKQEHYSKQLEKDIHDVYDGWNESEKEKNAMEKTIEVIKKIPKIETRNK